MSIYILKKMSPIRSWNDAAQPDIICKTDKDHSGTKPNLVDKI